MELGEEGQLWRGGRICAKDCVLSKQHVIKASSMG